MDDETWDNDEVNDNTVACPHCGQSMYDDAPQCPTCGQYVTSADFRKPFPTWLIWVIALTIFGLLLPTLWPIITRLL